jgi:ribosomal-protein-alanine N-acetyltransferase
MSAFLREGSRVKIRRPTSADQDEFISLMRQSQDLHAPWCFPPVTAEMFANYLKGRDQENQDGFLVCHAETHAIIGVINLNEIVRGCFQSAYLGYYIGAPFVGQGYMQEALTLVIQYAFTELHLHRLEANIQPENQASIALVRRCGFHREGFSLRYLNVNGEWKDHERWAILADEQ